MKLKDGVEHYTITEVAEMIGEITTTIYYHLKADKLDLPKPTIAAGTYHWRQEQVEEMRSKLANRKSVRGRQREEDYNPKPNSSYSKLKLENLALLSEVERLKKELGN